ncbi:MAG: LPP20 family lipoprotein [Fibromonadales bacterium]|nr:LPP20 family lipoprotein [Fibromonadales bacterium]
MRIKFCVLFLVMLADVAFSQSVMEALSVVQCASGDFRGVGIAQNENEAIAQARSMIASQIKSSVSYKSESKTDQRIVAGKEQLDSRNTMRTQQESNLLNAQDVQVKTSIVKSGSYGVVACMSRTNAAKPYAARQMRIADSLSILAQAVSVEKSPKSKRALWQRTSVFYSEYLENDKVLQSLGLPSEKNEEILKLYEFVKSDYQNFCSNQEIYWAGADNYGSKILHSKLSGDFVMKPGKCENGLQLSLLDSDVQCEYKASLGNYMCLFRPILKGESCAGEVFFQLPLNPALSIASKTPQAAENKLEVRIRNADIGEWKQDLKKWISSCAE